MKKNKDKNKPKSRSRNRNHYSYDNHMASADNSSITHDSATSKNRDRYSNFETMSYPLPDELKLPIGTVTSNGNQTPVYIAWLFCALIFTFASFLLWAVLSEKLLFIAAEIALLATFYLLLKRFSKKVARLFIDDDGIHYVCDPYPEMSFEVLWKNICPEYVPRIESGGRHRPDCLIFQHIDASNEPTEYKLAIDNWLEHSIFSAPEKRKSTLRMILKELARIPEIKIERGVFTKFDVDPETFKFDPSPRRKENAKMTIYSIILLSILAILWTFLAAYLSTTWTLTFFLISFLPVFAGVGFLIHLVDPSTNTLITYHHDIEE